MTARPLVAAAIAVLAPLAVAAATFDATSSDLVQQFRQLDAQGVVAAALSYQDADLPTPVTSRLEAAGLSFDQLSGLQQRALLWDAGAVVAPDGETLVQIYTAANASMADISVTRSEYLGAGCTYSNCTDASGSATKRSRYCTGDQIDTVVRCAATDVPGANETRSSMWATGIANATALPTPNIVRHDWIDDYSNISYLVFAIHMAASSAQPSWDTCALESGENYEAAMIIPCDVYSAANSSQWVTPASSPLMSLWLDEIAASASSASSLSSSAADASSRDAKDGETADGDSGGGLEPLLLLPIVAGAILLVLLAAFAAFRWRRHVLRRRMWTESNQETDVAVPADYFGGK